MATKLKEKRKLLEKKILQMKTHIAQLTTFYNSTVNIFMLDYRVKACVIEMLL